jgi:very-short-patch-repair endonuclease
MRASPKVIANIARTTRLARHRSGPTGIECILREALLPALLPGYEVLDEHPWYTYLVDAYVPALKLAVEADGSYWHSRPEIQQRDRIRDGCLTGHYGLTVVRFGERELNDYAVGRDPGPGFWHKIDKIEGMGK